MIDATYTLEQLAKRWACSITSVRRLIRDAIADIVRANPVLEHFVKVGSYKIDNPDTGATFEILSSDAATSYGQTPDIVVADELVHWPKAELWHSLFSSAAKKSNSVLCVITNAGWQQSEWWRVRESIRQDSGWRFSRLDGPRAPWITQTDLDEQRRHLPDKVFRRLWLNEWCDTAGDALELSDIDRAIVLNSAPNRLELGQVYVGGFDIGVARNHSALVLVSKSVGHSERISRPGPRYNAITRAMMELDLLDGPQERTEYRHHPGDGRLRLVAVKVWKPQGSRVSLEAVEKEILTLHDRFGISRLAFDPWQAEYLSERLTKFGVPTAPTHFTGNNLQAMASATLDAFRERQLDIFPHDQLLADLRALRVQEKSYGYRLTSPESEDGGHGDSATALSLALLAAKDIRSQYATCQRKLVFN